MSKTEEISCYVADPVSLSGLHAFPSVPSVLDLFSGHHCGICVTWMGFFRINCFTVEKESIEKEVLVGLYVSPTSLDETGQTLVLDMFKPRNSVHQLEIYYFSTRAELKDTPESA